ncbi:MAG: hypothetical protein ABIG44_16630 [Planctomycetota bacterium]
MMFSSNSNRAIVIRRALVGLGLVCQFCALADDSAVTFTTEGLALGISAEGRVCKILDMVTGVDRVMGPLPPYQKHVCAVKVGETIHYPTNCVIVGNLVTCTFGTLSPAPVIAVRIEERPRYLLFTLETASNTENVTEILFVNIWIKDPVEGTAHRFLKFDDGVERCMGIQPLDLFTRTALGVAPTGNYLMAVSEADLPHPDPVSHVGRRAAVFACNAGTANIYDIVGQIEQDHGLPVGVAGKQLPAVKRSCIFWMNITYENRGLALQYTRDAGAGRILMHHKLWGDPTRKMIPAERWGGVAGLRGWLDDCKAAGLTVGAHLFPGSISKESIDYIHAGCDPRLHRDRSITLAADLPADQVDGLIQTSTSPAGWPTGNSERDLVIGQEIIEYTGIQTQVPYGFTGPFVRAKNQTGEGGLGAQSHVAGAVIGHLDSGGSNTQYRWDIASGGVAQWCADIAETLDQVGFQFIYTDGVELTEEPLWYTTGYLSHTLYEAMSEPPPWVESSVDTAAYSWTLLGVTGQIDFSLEPNSFKREVDRNVERLNELYWYIGHLPRQLGWARLASPWDGSWETPPDELEYLLARSIAYDCPIVVEMWMSGLRDWPNRDANLYLMNQYEQLRLGAYFSAEQRNAARRAGKDYMLFKDAEDDYHLVPTTLLSIASWSSELRGYITDKLVDGHRYVTLWPTAADVEKLFFIDGITIGDVVVEDYKGDPVEVLDVGGGQVAIPVNTRIYIRLLNVPDPHRSFANATVRNAGDPGPGE